MVHRLQFRAMGTDMLVCVDNGSEQPPADLAEVPNWFEEWEQALSRFRPTSELSRLNRAAGQPIAVSEILWQVFQSALGAEKNTGGLVTPTVASAVREVGYDRDFALLAGQTLAPFDSGCAGLANPARIDWICQSNAAQAVSPLDEVTWDETTRTIYLPEGMQLDFGGIAKGWAAEQVVQRLKHHGAALMNCGGDIAMSGALLDGSPWEIGVHKPFDRSAGYLGMMYFREACGVATSSTDRRRWKQGNVLRHHIIDPRIGSSAVSDIVSATVVAPTAVDAEAAAKSVLIRGSAAGLDWLESDPNLAALLILENGHILYSERIREYL